MPAQMHECEQTEDSVIVCIEVTVLVRLVLAVPEPVDELFRNIVVGSEGSGGQCGHETDRVAESLHLHVTVPGRHDALDVSTVSAVLVHESVYALGIEEPLDGIGIPGLPLLVLS